jgi:hypothetical protein
MISQAFGRPGNLHDGRQERLHPVYQQEGFALRAGQNMTACGFCGFWKNLLRLSGAGEVASGVYIRG